MQSVIVDSVYKTAPYAAFGRTLLYLHILVYLKIRQGELGMTNFLFWFSKLF